MAAACELLSTTTLGGAASSITVSSISQAYHALRIVSLLETTNTFEFGGEVAVTYAGAGSGEYNNVSCAYYATTQGVQAKTNYTGSYSYITENTTTRSTQFGAGWDYTSRNCNNTASMDLYCAGYADTSTPLVVHIKQSKGAVGSDTPRQTISHGMSSTVSDFALTGITFTADSGNFTTASSVRIYGYIT